ncbi:MAG: hypothetical protein AAB794_03005 [Patescibacteria group bacterium]
MKKVQPKKVTKKTPSKKDMSVSELAGMVARGFSEVHVDMHNMEERLDGRIESVEGRLNILGQKADRIQDSVNELSYDSRKMRTRVDNLELKVFGSIQET